MYEKITIMLCRWNTDKMLSFFLKWKLQFWLRWKKVRCKIGTYYCWDATTWLTDDDRRPLRPTNHIKIKGSTDNRNKFDCLSVEGRPPASRTHTHTHTHTHTLTALSLHISADRKFEVRTRCPRRPWVVAAGR